MAYLAGSVSLICLACLVPTVGQSQESNGPRAGYVYPAGGRRGTTFRVVVGGQSLRGADEAYVSGKGVHAFVKSYVPALDPEDLGDAAWLLHELVRIRWSARVMDAVARGDAPTPPDHPWLRDLDEKSAADLANLRLMLFNPKKQANAQIAEQVELEITIDQDAPVGNRELRLGTPAGLTNPVRFQVGTLAEVREEDIWSTAEPEPKVLQLPTLVNGRIMPGEVDRFRLEVRQGMRLLVRAQARELVPYIADAVPGWFQTAIALRDSQGNELAYADDYRFHPDPVIFHEVPQDDVYTLEVRDALYRGRDDFVYRIAVGELPFVTHAFPLGAQVGSVAEVSLSGWNLPMRRLPLDTRDGDESLRWVELGHEEGLVSRVAYVTGTLPEVTEKEPNDKPSDAQLVELPLTINGLIASPGDVDRFRFNARAGDELVAEVLARRLNSPLDSALALVDPSGSLAASNDDFDDRTAGLITHQADSYLRAKIPQDGEYQIALRDTQHQGGEAFAYRLRLSAPLPDFAVRVVPSSISVSPGGSASLMAYAIRKDGFEGDIKISMVQAPPGFELRDARVPAGSDSSQVRLVAPGSGVGGVFALRLVARAVVQGAEVTRPVVPAEDMMQAFAYRHLVPQEELLVAVTRPWPVPAVWRPLLRGVRPISAKPVQLAPGQTAQVELRAAQSTPAWLSSSSNNLRFEAAASPRGVTLRDVEATSAGISLMLKADAYLSRPGTSGNLIVEVFRLRPDGSIEPGPQRASLGVLPPIPVEIVRR